MLLEVAWVMVKGGLTVELIDVVVDGQLPEVLVDWWHSLPSSKNVDDVADDSIPHVLRNSGFEGVNHISTVIRPVLHPIGVLDWLSLINDTSFPLEMSLLAMPD